MLLGRLLVPKGFSDFANISKDVVFPSAVNIVEIWDKRFVRKINRWARRRFADLNM
jgi:MraZ protein